MPRPAARSDAISHLRGADPVLKAIIDRVGPCGLVPKRHRDHFGTLARAIVFQQLSGKAAETIHGRYLALFPRVPTAEDVLAAPEPRLRSAGLSRAKAMALKDLASAALDGRVRLPVPSRLDDDGVIGALTRVRGIGPWTAQMFLMFHLGRPDVLPTGDFGFRTAAKRAYRLRGDPSPARLERLAEPWRPFRSFAVWYLWRSLEGGTNTDPSAAAK